MTSDASTLEARAEQPADDRIAAGLRGFGPLGIFAILLIFAGNVVVVPLSALLVLAWAGLSRTPWREIGYVRPESWTGSLAIGVAFGIALKFLMEMIMMPLLGADPINHPYHYLAGNRGALPAMLYAVIVGAGFGVHYPVQGLAGVEQAAIVGLVFGTIFAITGRIWMLMCAHAAFDVTAVAIIYWNLESDVAHLVFK